MAYYIDKAKFVGEVLTSSEQQLKFRGMTGEEAYFEALRLVNDMPAADVAEVRHGRWIDVEQKLLWCEDDVEICSCCSLCGAENALGETDFCPHCGADMRGANDEQL